MGCGECCNGDRCDDKFYFGRSECPYCEGTGQVKCNECGEYDFDIVQLSKYKLLCRECYESRLDDMSNNNG